MKKIIAASLGLSLGAILTCDGFQTIFYFEPWNENKFYGTGRVTWGSQSIAPGKYLSATKANSFQNIGL